MRPFRFALDEDLDPRTPQAPVVEPPAYAPTGRLRLFRALIEDEETGGKPQAAVVVEPPEPEPTPPQPKGGAGGGQSDRGAMRLFPRKVNPEEDTDLELVGAALMEFDDF